MIDGPAEGLFQAIDSQAWWGWSHCFHCPSIDTETTETVHWWRSRLFEIMLEVLPLSTKVSEYRAPVLGTVSITHAPTDNAFALPWRILPGLSRHRDDAFCNSPLGSLPYAVPPIRSAPDRSTQLVGRRFFLSQSCGPTPKREVIPSSRIPRSPGCRENLPPTATRPCFFKS